MHNLLSRGQLSEWKNFERSLEQAEIEHQKLNDYYECLIECDSLNQNHCKRVCKVILN
jgi:hypothetical protein